MEEDKIKKIVIFIFGSIIYLGFLYMMNRNKQLSDAYFGWLGAGGLALFFYFMFLHKNRRSELPKPTEEDVDKVVHEILIPKAIRRFGLDPDKVTTVFKPRDILGIEIPFWRKPVKMTSQIELDNNYIHWAESNAWITEIGFRVTSGKYSGKWKWRIRLSSGFNILKGGNYTQFNETIFNNDGVTGKRNYKPVLARNSQTEMMEMAMALGGQDSEKALDIYSKLHSGSNPMMQRPQSRFKRPFKKKRNFDQQQGGPPQYQGGGGEGGGE